jgi:hypothetical protein
VEQGPTITLLHGFAGMARHPLAIPSMVLRQYFDSYRCDVAAARAPIAMESSDVSDRERSTGHWCPFVRSSRQTFRIATPGTEAALHWIDQLPPAIQDRQFARRSRANLPHVYRGDRYGRPAGSSCAT